MRIVDRKWWRATGWLLGMISLIAIIFFATITVKTVSSLMKEEFLKSRHSTSASEPGCKGVDETGEGNPSCEFDRLGEDGRELAHEMKEDHELDLMLSLFEKSSYFGLAFFLIQVGSILWAIVDVSQTQKNYFWLILLIPGILFCCAGWFVLPLYLILGRVPPAKPAES